MGELSQEVDDLLYGEAQRKRSKLSSEPSQLSFVAFPKRSQVQLFGQGNFNYLDEFNTQVRFKQKNSEPLLDCRCAQGSQFENLSQNTLDMPYDTTQGPFWSAAYSI